MEKVAIHRCTATEGNQEVLMLKPFEPSVCCDLCGWSQEYPVSITAVHRTYLFMTEATYGLE